MPPKPPDALESLAISIAVLIAVTFIYTRWIRTPVSPDGPPTIISNSYPMTSSGQIYTPYPTLTSTVGISTSATSLPIVSFERVETEWPREMNLSNTGTIRLALLRTSDNTYQPTIEITGNSAIVATVVPIGTPQALLKDAFGPGYYIFAKANLTNPAFNINLVSPKIQPFDEPRLDWVWSISPQKTGEHILNASISILWALGATAPITTTAVNEDYIQRQVWHGNFKVNVTEPFVRRGSYTIGEIWQLLFGVVPTLLSPEAT